MQGQPGQHSKILFENTKNKSTKTATRKKKVAPAPVSRSISTRSDESQVLGPSGGPAQHFAEDIRNQTGLWASDGALRRSIYTGRRKKEVSGRPEWTQLAPLLSSSPVASVSAILQIDFPFVPCQA